MSFSSINSDAPEQVTRRYKGQFASLKFPRRVYKEYPKVIRDPSGKKIGRATNAMEEAEILANAGLEVSAVDPLAALQAQLAEAQEKLSQYEGKDLSKQIAAKKSGPQTATVEMLPADAPAGDAANVVEQQIGEVKGSPVPNPLLKPASPAGVPAPVGSAPKVSAPLKSGV